MCSIFGFYRDTRLTNPILNLGTIIRLATQCATRGRDGIGASIVFGGGIQGTYRFADVPQFSKAVSRHLIDTPHLINAILGNCRAEPTTEWQPDKNTDRLQPYSFEGVTAVHNGTIANDKQFLAPLGFATDTIDSQAIPVAASQGTFDDLIGSQATAIHVDRLTKVGRNLILRADEMMLHRNYRPLAVIYVPDLGGWLFASKLEFMLDALPPETTYQLVDMPANSSLVLPTMARVTHRAEGAGEQEHAVVILSGGLDSTTVAQAACHAHPRVTLVHFLYGCRAQSKETESVKAISEWLKRSHPSTEVALEFIDMSFLKQLGGSSLTDPDAEIAKGEEGAEFAHEWVPFRNGLMLSSIVAYCDRHKASHVYLGTNLEEAGAYGDNEQEFYELMGKAIAIGSKSAPKIVNLLENLMKHEIVKLAQANEAPVHLSWSCYHGGDHHCGNCGPCYMRKRAFAMNGLTDPLTYENDQ